MVSLPVELCKNGIPAEVKRELFKHGLWAILFTSLLFYTLWSGHMREEALMAHQVIMQNTQQQIVDEQKRLSDALFRVDVKIDKLIDRR